MAAEPQFSPPAELLADHRWVMALARRLVRDPATADDLVQEAWIATWRHGVGPTRGWLATVLRRRAAQDARSARARAAREARPRGTAPTPTPEELSERLEAQRMVIEAVQSLEEPYRSTLLLAYWEGLTSAEIGQRTGVPAGTVRWRIHEAQSMLRGKLDARFGGDRAAWCAALAPLCAAPIGAVAPIGISIIGLLLMKSSFKWAAACVLALTIGIGVYVAFDPAASMSEELHIPDAPAQVSHRPVQMPAALEAGEAAPSRATAANASNEEPKAAATGIAGRCVTSEGAPLAGIDISTRYVATPQRTTSGADGTFQIEMPDELGTPSHDFAASGRGIAFLTFSAAVTKGRVTQVGDVVLRPGGSVAGRVVDASGEPIAGAVISAHGADLPSREAVELIEQVSVFPTEPTARSGNDGAFVLTGLAPGIQRIFATYPMHLPAVSGPLEVRERQEAYGLELRLERIAPERFLRVRALDGSDTPLAHAKLYYRGTVRASSRSGTANFDGQGRFQMLARRGERFEVSLRDEHGSGTLAMAGDVDPADGEVILRQGDVKTISLIARGTEAKPILGTFSVHLLREPGGELLGVLRVTPKPDGKVQIPLPPSAFVLRVIAADYKLAKLGPFAPSSCPPALEVQLQAAPTLRGQVTYQGKPAPGAAVAIYPEAKGKTTHNGFPVRAEPQLAERTATDANGEYKLPIRITDRYFVRAWTSEGAAESGPIALDESSEPPPLDLQMRRGGTLVGKVIPPRGRSAAGVIVGISRGDGFPKSQRTGEDGTYRFDGLMPGRWLVKALSEELIDGRSHTRTSRGSWGELPWSCEVVEEGEVRFDLLLGEQDPDLELRGKLSIDGGFSGLWNASSAAFESDVWEQGTERTPLAGDGSFVLHSSKEGRARVVLTALGGAMEGVRILCEADVRPGSLDLRIDLRSARLDVRYAPEAPRGPLALVVECAPRVFAVSPLLEAAESGVRTLPSGKCKIVQLENVRKTARLEDLPSIQTVDLPAGSESTVTIR
ncbi:MAG: sigma-70 family RNA polymerase sigma factor [Planctomycetes bacterium]|nr:sigma-70 family RNA polymerase sigma factor [Planctomycetota bacterium]